MENGVHTKDFFSPSQIYIGTFIGGPLAAAYYLSTNFRHMERGTLNTVCIVVGVIFTLLVFGLSLQLPENFPNTIIPVAYSAVAAGIAWQWQVSKEEIEAVESYGFQSNWKVAGVSALFFIISLVILIAFVMLVPVE